MMLHRSSSSRRRRASRSVANSPQDMPLAPTMRGRRASVASTEASDVLAQTYGGLDRERSPRGSIVPNISLDLESDVLEETFNRRLLPDPEQCSRLNLSIDIKNRSSRNSLVPEDYSRSSRTSLLSPRNSLTPEMGRSPRGSLIPEVTRSPRHSIVADIALSPRNTMMPSEIGYNRGPRNSLSASNVGARAPLLPENGISRSPRHSLVPETLSSRSPRGSVPNIDFDRSPRGSICPEMSRIPRGSLTSTDQDRIPRDNMGLEYTNQSPRGSIAPELGRYQRGSMCVETNRSPRGSVCPDMSRSPRGSIGFGDVEKVHRGSLGSEEGNRTPRGSIGPDMERSPRGSITADHMERSPRGSIGPDMERSSRGSIGGLGQERRMSRAGQDHRRMSVDQNTPKIRSVSSNQLKDMKTASVRSEGEASRMLFSGDESRRLCGGVVSGGLAEKGAAVSSPVVVATYGSLVFQLKDAHLEANGTCDFVFRALHVVSKTVVVTICLAGLSTMHIVMFIMGLQFIKDCPKEPRIPIYMVVGGILGGTRTFWTLYSQVHSKRTEILAVPEAGSCISPMKLISIALTLFLLVWFVLGNFWILNIRWPEYVPDLFEPNRWCDKTLYIFSLIHLCVVYVFLTASVLTGLSLAICRLFGCPWPERYK